MDVGAGIAQYKKSPENKRILERERKGGKMKKAITEEDLLDWLKGIKLTLKDLDEWGYMMNDSDLHDETFYRILRKLIKENYKEK